MRAKARPVILDADDGPPWPLSLGPTVEHFAPEFWQNWHGQQPPHDHPDHIASLLQARRVHAEYHRKWAHDVGLDDDQARRTRVNGRPRW